MRLQDTAHLATNGVWLTELSQYMLRWTAWVFGWLCQVLQLSILLMILSAQAEAGCWRGWLESVASLPWNMQAQSLINTTLSLPSHQETKAQRERDREKKKCRP